MWNWCNSRHDLAFQYVTSVGFNVYLFYSLPSKIEKFINKYSSIIDDVNFLNSFLESLEQRYFMTKSGKLDISDVISKLKKIYPN